MDKQTIFIALFSGTASAILVSLLNHFLGKKKRNVEIAKLKAETNKLIKENQIISDELSMLQEDILYSGENLNEFSFKGKNGYIRSSDGKNIGNKSDGNFFIKNDVISIERDNIDGKYELNLIQYENRTTPYIEADETLNGQRKIGIRLDVKASKGTTHTVNFVLKDKKSGVWLNNKNGSIVNLVKRYNKTKI